MVKGGIERIDVSDGEDDTSGSAVTIQKKAKGSKGQAVATWTVEAFLDRAMSTEEVDKANICMLRLVINIALIKVLTYKNMLEGSSFMQIFLFQLQRIIFFLKWLNGLRPSFAPASCYVLMERYLPAEEQ